MGTWSTTAPTNTYGNWTETFIAEASGNYHYFQDNATGYYDAYFQVKAECSAIRLTNNCICVRIKCYGKRNDGITNYGHYLNNRPYITDENGNLNYGTKAQGTFTDDYTNITTQYYTFPNTYKPTSIICGNDGLGYNGNGNAQVTITVIPSPAGALLWANINNEWKEAQIFSSTGTSWNEGIIFNTTHLPS